MSILSITLFQSELHWENKEANLQMFEEKISSLKNKGNVIVLPEMFSTGFSMNPDLLAETMDGNTFQWMKKISSKHKVIVTGSFIVNDTSTTAEAGYFNRLIWMLPNGEYAYYDKRHLFAYAQEDKHYTAGNKRLIGSVNGWRINLMVCYDLRFPVWSRQNPSHSDEDNREYDILIYVANWPERRSLAWITLLQARAIENLCYVIGVNRVGYDGNDIYYSGDSMVVDPSGEILYHKANEEDAFTITFNKDHLEKVRAKFPFWRDADNFRILT